MSNVGCLWCPLCHWVMFRTEHIQWCTNCFDNGTNISYNDIFYIWNYNGISYTQKEFSRLLKLKAFC